MRMEDGADGTGDAAEALGQFAGGGGKVSPIG